jgi:hypothetical protein
MSYGATENELQAIFIKMVDCDRLKLARSTLNALELLGKRGTVFNLSYLFRC